MGMPRIIAGVVLLAGLCLAQQETPSFRAQSDLVTVPFQVRRGSRSVADLKASEVVLLEDGAPRGFTVFEPPSEHPSLELAVLFDVTRRTGEQGRSGVFWDEKALEELAGYWNDANARRLLDGKGDPIRFSIYRLDQDKLQRLCRATSDPAALREALGQLNGPKQADAVPLPTGLTVRAAERKRLAKGMPPQQWSLAAAFAALRDSANDSSRALVIFSTGAEGSTLTPDDLADQAAWAGVPVYPVALFSGPVGIVAYEGYSYNGLFVDGDDYGGVQGSMWGPAGPYQPAFGPADRPNIPQGSPPVARYLNWPFEHMADLTGGIHFEAVNHSVRLGDSGERYVLDRLTRLAFSMTGRESEDVLERVKRHALARFHSSYTIGFAPEKSAAPKEHKLEVKLAPKTGGKVTEGTRIARY